MRVFKMVAWQQILILFPTAGRVPKEGGRVAERRECNDIYGKISDIKERGGYEMDPIHNFIILVQPTATLQTDKSSFLSVKDEELNALFGQVMGPSGLTHVSSISLFCNFIFQNHLGWRKPLVVFPCGGELQFSYPANGKFVFGKECAISITCSKCSASLKFFDGQAQFKALWMLLLIKQIAPDLPYLNFIDFAIWPEDEKFEGEELSKIHQLGLISLAKQKISGTCNLRNDSGHPSQMADDRIGFDCYGRWHDIGFMLMPGMKTLSDFDGYDKWARLLMCEYYTHIHNIHRYALPGYVGPK